MVIGMGLEMIEHIYHKCNEENCSLCDTGLLICDVCGCAEGTLASECPGTLVPNSVQESIYNGTKEFINGRWVETAVVDRTLYYVIDCSTCKGSGFDSYGGVCDDCAGDAGKVLGNPVHLGI